MKNNEYEKIKIKMWKLYLAFVILAGLLIAASVVAFNYLKTLVCSL